jgi:hypothetical protein
MKRFALLLPLLFIPLASPAASPIVTHEAVAVQLVSAPEAVAIIGPDTSEPGDLVVLKVVGDAKGYAWDCFPENKKWATFDGGKSIVFASGKAGVYTFILATATGDVPTISKKSVTIGVIPPGPDPPPGPNPPPVPPGPGPIVPDGDYGLTKLVYEVTMKMPAAERARCSASFADNFKVVANGLATNTYLSIGVANAELTALNRTTAGASLELWKTTVFIPQGQAMQTLALTDMARVAQAYYAVAAGFKLAKGN